MKIHKIFKPHVNRMLVRKWVWYSSKKNVVDWEINLFKMRALTQCVCVFKVTSSLFHSPIRYAFLFSFHEIISTQSQAENFKQSMKRSTARFCFIAWTVWAREMDCTVHTHEAEVYYRVCLLSVCIEMHSLSNSIDSCVFIYFSEQRPKKRKNKSKKRSRKKVNQNDTRKPELRDWFNPVFLCTLIRCVCK